MSNNNLSGKSSGGDLKSKLSEGLKESTKGSAMQNVPGGETAEKAQKAADSVRKTSQMLNKASSMGQSAIQGLAALLVNPITWIVIAVLLVLTYAYSTTLVLGKDDDNCDSSGSMNVVGWPGDDAPLDDRALAIGSWLTNNPFSANNGQPMSIDQAAALVGILIAESDLNPSLIQDGAGPGPKATNAQMLVHVSGHTASNGGAIGLFQHRGERAKAMIELAESSGRQWNDVNVQLEHFAQEMKTSYNADNLARAGFWKGGQSIEYYSDLLNRYLVVSCRHHTDSDHRGCAESYDVDWREAGRRTVKESERLAELFKSNGGGSKSSSSSGSSTVSGGTSGVTDGATSTQFPGKEGLKEHTLKYAEHIGSKFGIATIGGYRPVDPYPDHPSGLALDIMIENKAVGDAIAEYFIQNESAFAPIYMIWQQRYYNFPNGGRSPVGTWIAMEDRGSPTQNHMDHIHILFKSTPGDGNWSDSTAGSCSAGSQSSGEWTMPTCGTYTSGWGMRYNPGPYGHGVLRLHAGVDIGAPEGTDVKAAKGGVVEVPPFDADGLGNYVKIRHEGENMTTIYGHMVTGSIAVTTGQKVSAGDLIGKVGNTGNSRGAHLHFEIHTSLEPKFSQNLENTTSVDPVTILKPAGLNLEMGQPTC